MLAAPVPFSENCAYGYFIIINFSKRRVSALCITFFNKYLASTDKLTAHVILKDFKGNLCAWSSGVEWVGWPNILNLRVLSKGTF